jgi:hypothetical protein
MTSAQTVLESEQWRERLRREEAATQKGEMRVLECRAAAFPHKSVFLGPDKNIEFKDPPARVAPDWSKAGARASSIQLC